MDELVLKDNYRIKMHNYPKFVAFDDCRTAVAYSLLLVSTRFRFHLSLSSFLYSQIILKVAYAEKELKIIENREIDLKTLLNRLRELKSFFCYLQTGNSNEPNISKQLLSTFQMVLFQETKTFDENLQLLSKELRLYLKVNQKIFKGILEDPKFPSCLIRVKVFKDANQFKVMIHRDELDVDLNFDKFCINLFRRPFVKYTNSKSYYQNSQKTKIVTSKLESFLASYPYSEFFFQKFLEILSENPEEITRKIKKQSGFQQEIELVECISIVPKSLRITCISCGKADQESTFRCKANCFICNLCRTQDCFKCLSCFRDYTQAEKDVLKLLDLIEIDED